MKSLKILAFTLGVVFIILQLTKQIDWSLWWVLAPFWGYVLIYIAALLFKGYLERTYPDRLKRAMQQSLANASKKIKEENERRERERQEEEANESHV